MTPLSSRASEMQRPDSYGKLLYFSLDSTEIFIYETNESKNGIAIE